MSLGASVNDGGHKRLLVPCNCAGTCSYLVVDRFDFDDEFYADVFVRPGAGAWRWRIKSAWRTLRGQQIGQDMTLSAAEARLLRDWLLYELQITSPGDAASAPGPDPSGEADE